MSWTFCWNKWIRGGHWNFKQFFKCLGEKPVPVPPAPLIPPTELCNVCNVSGLLPGPYCPLIVSRTFPAGGSPTGICNIHHPQCAIPYSQTGIILCEAPACLTLFCCKDGETFKMAEIPAYLDQVVLDGLTCVRGFGQSNDNTPNLWESWRVMESGYEAHIRQILGWIKERNLTAIFTLTPYGGEDLTDAQYVLLLNILKDFRPNIIVEIENEPLKTSIQADRLVPMIKAAGFTESEIQVEFYDSSDFYNMLLSLNSKAPTCLHFTAGMADVNKPHPDGWTTSPGIMDFVHIMRMYPSSDGGTGGNNGQFPFPEWKQHPEAHTSNADDAYQVTKWNLKEKGRGFEYLSPWMFTEELSYPDVKLGISGGQDVRQAIRRAYDEFVKGV